MLVSMCCAGVARVDAQEFPRGDVWVEQGLDPMSSGNPGRDSPPAATSYFGEPHVFYYDETSGDLRHGVWRLNDIWVFETLDGQLADTAGRVDANVGQTPSVVVLDDELHVFYYDASANDLRHGTWTPAAGRWIFEIVDGSVATTRGQSPGTTGLHPSAVVNGNELHVFYNRNIGQGDTIGHATLGGDRQWYAQDLIQGASPSAVVYANQLHVFFTLMGLGHVVFDGTSWLHQQFETVQATHSTLFVGAMPAAIVHRDEIFVLSMTGGITGFGQRVHHWDGSRWAVVPISFGLVRDVSTFVSDGSVLDLLYSTGNPIVPQRWVWSRWTGAVFSTMVVDHPAPDARGVGLAYAHEAHVFYAQNGSLMHAVRINGSP